MQKGRGARPSSRILQNVQLAPFETESISAHEPNDLAIRRGGPARNSQLLSAKAFTKTLRRLQTACGTHG